MRPSTILTIAVLLAWTSACDNPDEVWTRIWERQHGQGSEAGSGSDTDTDPGEPKLPKATNACPTIDTGTLEFLGVPVQIWLGQNSAGTKRPLLFYWHGTGSYPGEAELMLGDAFNELIAEGALIVSPGATLATGHD